MRLGCCKALAGVLLAAAVSLCAAESANVWLNVPYVRQTRDGCGAASLAMIMQYWQNRQGRPSGMQSDPMQILHALYSRDAHGIYASAMAQYLQKNGYRTFVLNGEWADFERELAKGRPLIAALRPGGSRTLHYVVVAGVDDKEQLVLVNDPAQRKLLKEDRASFEKEWKATGNWTLLAVPAAGLP